MYEEKETYGHVSTGCFVKIHAERTWIGSIKNEKLHYTNFGYLLTADYAIELFQKSGHGFQ